MVKRVLRAEEIKVVVNAMADCDLSVPKAAVKCGMSTATMYRYCDMIEAQTGYDPRRFWNCYLLCQKANFLIKEEKKKKSAKKVKEES